MFQDDGSQKAEGDVVDTVPEVQETVQVIPGSKLLWRVNTRPPNSAQVRMPPCRSGPFCAPKPWRGPSVVPWDCAHAASGRCPGA